MTMKHLLLFVLFIPTLLWAQNDSIYLAGGVPEEEGRVVFTKEIEVPQLSSSEIYDRMYAWAKTLFNTEASRIVYSNKEKGEIAIVAEEYLVFANTALALDRTLINYRLTIECENHLCKLKLGGIRYEYNVAYQRDPQRYLAEKWITDKYALNKAKTRLNRGNGKFRVKTIDLVNDLFRKATEALGIQPTPLATPVQPAASVIPATPITPAVPVKEGYVALAPDKIPSTLLQLLSESTMQITLSTDQKEIEKAGVWKGIGTMFGKKIASFNVDPDSPVYKQIQENGLYSISFFKKYEPGEAWLIMDCCKQGETADGQQKTVIGEIIQVWVK